MLNAGLMLGTPHGRFLWNIKNYDVNEYSLKFDKVMNGFALYFSQIKMFYYCYTQEKLKRSLNNSFITSINILI